MIFNQTLPIVERIQAKKAMLLRGDKNHQSIRFAIIACGGSMRGVFGAGAMIGLELSGLSQVADVVIGVSAGAANIAHLLSEQTISGTSVYYNDLVDKRFINPFRPWKMVDVDYLERVFREVKVLDLGAVRRSRPEFYTVATKLDGEMVFLNAKSVGVDTLTAIKASMAIPILYNRPVNVSGELYLDGVASSCLPVMETLEKFSPTDILIILNTTLDQYWNHTNFHERILAKLFLRKFSRKLREGFLGRNTTYNSSINFLEYCQTCNIGVVSPDYEISRSEQNPEVLKQNAFLGAKKIYDVFGSSELKFSDVII